MLTVRKNHERGHADHGWLEARHSFSFAHYYDADFMGFRTLRVLNDDIIRPGTGFDMHGHRNMEVVTYILEGAIRHRDSLGHASVIRAGEAQRMTAGKGIRHSEYNASDEEPLRLLQIWIHPEAEGLDPGYAEQPTRVRERPGVLTLIASRDGREGSLTIHQDASIHAAVLNPGQRIDYAPEAGRGIWVQMARGSARLNGLEMEEGDGAALEDEATIVLEGISECEILLFDLA